MKLAAKASCVPRLVQHVTVLMPNITREPVIPCFGHVPPSNCRLKGVGRIRITPKFGADRSWFRSTRTSGPRAVIWVTSIAGPFGGLREQFSVGTGMQPFGFPVVDWSGFLDPHCTYHAFPCHRWCGEPNTVPKGSNLHLTPEELNSGIDRVCVQSNFYAVWLISERIAGNISYCDGKFSGL